MANNLSPECVEALRLLAHSRNVLISGPPGTGKSRLLSEVAQAFATGIGMRAAAGPPVHQAAGGVPIPPTAGQLVPASANSFPAPTKTKREVFRTVFHQNSKHRDFVTGIAPVVVKKEGEADFRIIQGILYRASEHAKSQDGAALLIIDEINRGPAVQVFGGAIVAIESDKRLDPDGTRRVETQCFELMDPSTGELIEYALPHDLYILAAMNQADASVEPLDVAFLRRWEPMKLEPNLAILRQFYGLPDSSVPIPDEPTTPEHVFEASAQAWRAVNAKISLGRGREFQIGHGILMSGGKPGSMTLDEAKTFISLRWAKVFTHIEEVFFGDVRGVAATLNVLRGPVSSPFKLIETTFADELRFVLSSPSTIAASNIYPALRAIVAPND